MMIDLIALADMAREEFPDIVVDTRCIDAKLRQHLDGTIHRHDNSPRRKWQHIQTFPQHYHREREEAVTESYLPLEPREAVRTFLAFCRQIIRTGESSS
jgi:Family of unknown function (DUF6516)